MRANLAVSRQTCGQCPSSVRSALSGERTAGDSDKTVDDCPDITPPDGYPCEQQLAWGRCSTAFILASNWCAATCGRCGAMSVDRAGAQPLPAAVAEQPSVHQRLFFGAEPEVECNDNQPVDGTTCEEHKELGNCISGYLLATGYCRLTCGHCSLPGAKLPGLTSPDANIMTITTNLTAADFTAPEIISANFTWPEATEALEASSLTVYKLPYQEAPLPLP